jgi:hypothetical protein
MVSECAVRGRAFGGEPLGLGIRGWRIFLVKISTIDQYPKRERKQAVAKQYR